MKNLFFECEFAQLCWASLHFIWDLSLSVPELIEDSKRHFQFDCYMEVVVLAGWCIWIHRNNLICNGVQISFARWKNEFRDLF
jgi:hypothetical protein